MPAGLRLLCCHRGGTHLEPACSGVAPAGQKGFTSDSTPASALSPLLHDIPRSLHSSWAHASWHLPRPLGHSALRPLMPLAHLPPTLGRLLLLLLLLCAGQTILVLGAAGGVGLAAVQLAKCMGARVVAVARGPSKMQALREVGAHP